LCAKLWEKMKSVNAMQTSKLNHKCLKSLDEIRFEVGDDVTVVLPAAKLRGTVRGL